MTPDSLTQFIPLLQAKFGERGGSAGKSLHHWLSGAVPYSYPEILERHLDPRHTALVFDSFWQLLPFGTGGRRGKVGYGPNRINPSTIALTVQGHCSYLRKRFGDDRPLSVVVANDVRVFNDFGKAYAFLGSHPLLGLSSRLLAKLACEVYAGNGIRCYLPDPESDQALYTTPELSFAIPELSAVGGVNISASHNPPDDNGIKVYDETGSQPIAPDDQRLIDAMAAVSEVRRTPFAEALGKGYIQPIPPAIPEKYLKVYVGLYPLPKPDRKVPIVFTPLSGCGQRTVGAVLSELGFSVSVPADQEADGTFASIPLRAPNPEIPEATAPARTYADSKGAGLVLSSDPDADRVGAEVKLQNGSWYHLDGNQIAAVLGYFLMLDPAGPRRTGLVLETLVTTKLLGRIAKAGNSYVVDDLLVGFKYVAAALKRLNATGKYDGFSGSLDDFVFAAEESHGVILTPSIRDKDATPACMLLAGLHEQLKPHGRTLVDYYMTILEKFGPFVEVARSLMMSGAAGVENRDRIMTALRAAPPELLGGLRVNRIEDHWDQNRYGQFVSESDMLPRNVIQYFLENTVITIRPSGTEPKLKIYCHFTPEPASVSSDIKREYALAKQRLEEISVRVYNDLADRIGMALGECGLALPDIIELERKADFEKRILPRFSTQIREGAFANRQSALEWLKQESRDLLPGADPLPALKNSLRVFCRSAESSKNASDNLIQELKNWAGE